MSSTEKKAVIHRFYKWKNNTIQHKITDFYGIFRENTRIKPIVSYRPVKSYQLINALYYYYYYSFYEKIR